MPSAFLKFAEHGEKAEQATKCNPTLHCIAVNKVYKVTKWMTSSCSGIGCSAQHGWPTSALHCTQTSNSLPIQDQRQGNRILKSNCKYLFSSQCLFCHKILRRHKFRFLQIFLWKKCATACNLSSLLILRDWFFLRWNEGLLLFWHIWIFNDFMNAIYLGVSGMVNYFVQLHEEVTLH